VRRRIVAPLFNYFNRIDSPVWDVSDKKASRRQAERSHRRLLRRESIDRPRMRMIVVIVRVHPDAVRLRVMHVRNEEMGVHDTRFRMVIVIAIGMLGTGMNVLKRRDKERQDNCQASLNGQRATHH
jgi:hypothetical protein